MLRVRAEPAVRSDSPTRNVEAPRLGPPGARFSNGGRKEFNSGKEFDEGNPWVVCFLSYFLSFFRGEFASRVRTRVFQSRTYPVLCEKEFYVNETLSMHPKGTPAPTPTVKAQVFEERVDLSNNMTWRQMIAVGVRRVVLARGELDKLEGPGYAARRAELRREARARDRQAAAASQDEADESDATEEEATGGRTTRVGRPRGGMKVAARSGERLRREIGRGRRPRVGDG